MTWLRIGLASVAATAACLIGALALALDGYLAENDTTPADTDTFVVVWMIPTVILVALIAVAVGSEARRKRLSWLAVYLAAAMAASFGLLLLSW